MLVVVVASRINDDDDDDDDDDEKILALSYKSLFFICFRISTTART